MTEKVDFLLYFRKKVFQKHIFVWFSLSLALLFGWSWCSCGVSVVVCCGRNIAYAEAESFAY